MFAQACTRNSQSLHLDREQSRIRTGVPARRGVVLIVVLVLVVMIALAGFGFLAAMSTEYEAVRLDGSRLQAEQTMASAEASVLWIASLTEQQRRLMGDTVSNTILFQGRVLEPLKATATGQMTGTTDLQNLATESASPGSSSGSGMLPDDRWRYSVLYYESSGTDGPALRFGLRNESAKLHLGSVLRWDQQRPGQGRASLMQLPGMTEAIADAVLDWIDADEIPREFGAESEHYMTLSQPYRSANAIPQNLEELLYVRGISRTRLFGIGEQTGGRTESRGESALLTSGETSNSSFTTAESMAINRSSSDMIPGGPSTIGDQSGEAGQYTGRFGWAEYLTVSSAERNREPKGALRTFVNGNALPQLQSELQQVFPAPVVRFILLARQFGIQPIAAPQATGLSNPGTDVMSIPFSASTPLQFSINNLADLIDARVSVSTSAGVQLVQSPVSTQAPDFTQMWSRITRYITTTPDSVVIGRVNVLQASEPVLRAIPGITPEAAAQIISRRSELEIPPTSTGWILSENLMDSVGFRAMMPEVTTGGDVFEADIVVFRAIGGPVLRRKVVVDAASDPVRRLQWRDISSHPLPYSINQLLPSELTSPDNSATDVSDG